MKFARLPLEPILIPAAVLVMLCVSAAYGQPSSANYPDIASILEARCGQCHSGTRAAAGFRVDSYQDVMTGGKAGKMVIPGEPDKSELVRRIKGTSRPRMPKNGPPWLSDSQITLIQQWIAAGARE